MTRDATTALLRAIGQAIPPDADWTIEKIASRSWASATFTGARHEILLAFRGAEGSGVADAFACGLEERDFTLRGHILADISLAGRSREGEIDRLRVEALTVEDW